MFGQSEIGQISEPRPDCSQTQLGLDPLDSPQSDAAVQRHLRIRPPGSRRGAQVLHDKLSFQLIIHDWKLKERPSAFLWRLRVIPVNLPAIDILPT